jgi:hypothetical protein
MKTKQAFRKKTEPDIDQKRPIEAMQNPIAETTKGTQPVKFIL